MPAGKGSEKSAELRLSWEGEEMKAGSVGRGTSVLELHPGGPIPRHRHSVFPASSVGKRMLQFTHPERWMWGCLSHRQLLTYKRKVETKQAGPKTAWELTLRRDAHSESGLHTGDFTETLGTQEEPGRKGLWECMMQTHKKEELILNQAPCSQVLCMERLGWEWGCSA